MRIIEIKYIDSDILLLRNFLDNLGEASTSFRYFNSRQLTAIENHIVTLLVIDGELPVGYGHLDQEGEVVWLGISILPSHQGLGLGSVVMKALLSCARKFNLSSIFLTVDKCNLTAQNLYEKFEFVKVKDEAEILQFKLNLKYE